MEDTVTVSAGTTTPARCVSHQSYDASHPVGLIEGSASHDHQVASEDAVDSPITDVLPVTPCTPLTLNPADAKRNHNPISNETAASSDEDIPISTDPEPVARIMSYKGRGDQGDFCVFTLHSSLAYDFPPPMVDIKTKTADLFAHIHPETGDTVMWMRDMRDVWVSVEEGATHPTMSHRCLHIKKPDGSADAVPNWVLRDTIRKYKQQALRDSRLREVSVLHIQRRLLSHEPALDSTE